MIPFTLGDKTVQVPMALHELTTGQLIQLFELKNKQDECEIASILTGIPRHTWMQTVMDEATTESYNEAISWLFQVQVDDYRPYKFPRPEKITLGEKNF